MTSLIPIAIAVVFNLFLSQLRVLNKNIKKGIKTFRVKIIDGNLSNSKIGVDISSLFKRNMEMMLENVYKLRKFDTTEVSDVSEMDNFNQNPDLYLIYVFSDFGVKKIDEKPDYSLVRFTYSLGYAILGENGSIKDKTIELEIKKSDVELNKIISKIVEIHLSEFVDSFLIEQ